MKMTTKKISIKEIALIGLFTALVSIGAFIRVPVPVVPFTLQFLFTTLAGLLLGSRLGGISVMAYIALGLMGLPVFASGGGIGYVFTPTFGYLIGFVGGAYITGFIAERAPDNSYPSLKRLIAASFAGLAVVYIVGMVYYYVISNLYLGAPIGLWPLFLYCFILAVPGDILLCFIAATMAKRILPIIRKDMK